MGLVSSNPIKMICRFLIQKHNQVLLLVSSLNALSLIFSSFSIALYSLHGYFRIRSRKQFQFYCLLKASTQYPLIHLPWPLSPSSDNPASPLRFSEFLSHSNISGSNLLTIRDLGLWIAFIHNKEMFYLWICTLKFCFIYILIEVWSIYRDHLYIMDSSRPFKDFTRASFM